MSSGAEHRICDAIRDCHEKDSPGWEEAEKPYDRPEQPALDASRVNCVFYYGASFNPPHETHGRILKTIYDDAGPHMMSSLDAHLAGALVGCSAHADLLQKTSEQKIPIPLPSRDRLQLWHEGASRPRSAAHPLSACTDRSWRRHQIDGARLGQRDRV